jgi:hypothetical protein
MTSTGNPGAGTIVKGGQNPRPQNQSIIDTTKGDTKNRVAVEPEAGSGSGEPPLPPRTEGAINTTRSNIKNTS